MSRSSLLPAASVILAAAVALPPAMAAGAPAAHLLVGTDTASGSDAIYLYDFDTETGRFVPGASAFPQGLGYNPTGLVAALTYWSAKAIRERYLKEPRPLAWTCALIRPSSKTPADIRSRDA